MKKGLIIGKGWLGSRLEEHLAKHYQITSTKRQSDAPNCLSINFDQTSEQSIDSSIFEFIILTIPFGKRNTTDELRFRFDQIIHFIGEYNGPLFLISSTGIYPDLEKTITENTLEERELNQPYYFIENKLQANYPQLTILRLGGLMGDNRRLSNYLSLDHPHLNQVVNHIHFEDVCRIIAQLIQQNKTSTIYNIVAPEHPTKEEVLTYQIQKKTIYSEIKKGKTVLSDKLIIELNYQFIFPNPLYY
ncbi:epimerase [Empedobacter falsenii]